jgi:Holliday junction resolvase RusA-like endonuclease
MTDALFETPAVGTAPVVPAAVHEAGQTGLTQGEGVSSVRPVLDIHVTGIPQPQGSKKGFVNPRSGRAIIVDDNKKTLRTWRDDVKAGAQEAILAREGTGDCFAMLGGPVGLDITFLMPRPKGHYGTGRNAGVLKDSAPKRPTTKPDIDKLMRSTLDALRDVGVYVDDSQVVTLTGRKVYANGAPGAHIHIFTGDTA